MDFLYNTWQKIQIIYFIMHFNKVTQDLIKYSIIEHSNLIEMNSLKYKIIMFRL